MSAEQVFQQPFPNPRDWTPPDLSEPSYITRMMARLGDIETRLARIEAEIAKLQP